MVEYSRDTPAETPTGKALDYGVRTSDWRRGYPVGYPGPARLGDGLHYVARTSIVLSVLSFHLQLRTSLRFKAI